MVSFKNIPMKNILFILLFTTSISYTQTYYNKQLSRDLLIDILKDEFKNTEKRFFDVKTLSYSMEVNNVFFIDASYSKMAQSHIFLENSSKEFVYNVISYMYRENIIHPVLENVDIISIYFNIYFKSNDDKEIIYLYYINTEYLVKITDKTTKEDFFKNIHKK